MNYFIKNIHINKLFHLKDLDIPIANEKYPHLIITGKNGSGKTILLNAIVNWLEYYKNGKLIKDNIGAYYWINGDYDLALYYFLNALKEEKKDNYFHLLNLIACVYVAKGDYELAKAYFRKVEEEEVNRRNGRELRMVENRFSNKKSVSESEKMILDDSYDFWYNYYCSLLKEINMNVFCNFTSDIGDISDKEFVLAYYPAQRSNNELKMIEPKSPTKPELNTKVGIKETYTDKFLEFLSDLRIQGALARNEKQFNDAHRINAWFNDFVKLLKQVFQDNTLKLEFDYRNYSFKICTEGKKFKFTELADGFAAVLDIIADLILKMQESDSLTRVYDKKGIVLIDEIETHLHLSLQKVIMPILTRVFPNIQFIVTTHSPFVLNSMPNAMAYDLEHKQPIDDLTNYSYESLAEGYFGISTESSTVEMRLHRLQELLNNESLTNSDKNEIRQLIVELDKISEAVSPDLVGEYLKVKLNNVDKIREIDK